MAKLLTKPALLLAIAALALGLGAGCGGDNDSYTVDADTTVTTASFPEAQLMPRISRICREAWPTILDNFATYSRWQDPDMPRKRRFAEALRLSLLAGIVFHIFDPIYNMGAPQGNEGEIEEIIGTMQSASERGQKGLAPLSSIADAESLYGDYNELARDYGLDECLIDRARLAPLVS